jgi:hypothetical protein
MTVIDAPVIETSELRARAAMDGDELIVSFAGSADSRAMASIEGLLSRLNEEAQRLAVPEVRVDFREFDFMNSSCFKAFVTWIGRVQDLPAAKQYRIRFLSDQGKHWQRRSLDALRCFASDLIQIDS